MQLTWSLKPFYSLTLDELYQLLRLRSEVFVVEQTCPFLDMDNKDQLCHHLMGWTPEGTLAAYTRIVPPGLSYEEASIGRVVSSPQYRRYGIGRHLMQQSIQSVEQLYGTVPIRIGAQLYLKKFYKSFGFEQVGDMYLEDDIEHIEMLRKVG
ncbi:GNAT family N-acetyltransferase [Telluribacter humicola]|uniref:GNAT family N-acetyltransferase n=1 Tax=Telluribacter humicola TaxID=1720261 RepID=UPI001A957D54|nr:GNAT family N-acetyltransferase [Telluribacter humicola]